MISLRDYLIQITNDALDKMPIDHKVMCWNTYDLGLKLSIGDSPTVVALVKIIKSRTKSGGPKQVYEAHFEFRDEHETFKRVAEACKWAEKEVRKYYRIIREDES